LRDGDCSPNTSFPIRILRRSRGSVSGLPQPWIHNSERSHHGSSRREFASANSRRVCHIKTSVIKSSSQMRPLANLVLLVILWSYAAPAALGATQADLPACCRNNGKHHCAMASMAGGSGGAAPAFRVNAPRCPYLQLGSVFSRHGVAEAGKSFSLGVPASDRFTPTDFAFHGSDDLIRTSERSPPTLSLN
jgi:hypothetical protein